MERNDSEPVREPDTDGQKDQSIEKPIKHPLENKWNFWLYTNKSKVWDKNLVNLATFDTVEDYWCLYHHMKLPSELELGQDYMIFKDGIKPMWEDKANKNGGRWLIIPFRHNFNELDNYWLGVVLLMIGGNFQHSDALCGAIVNIRDKSKICVWTRSAEEKANIEIARKIKKQLRIPSKLSFYLHNSITTKYTV